MSKKKCVHPQSTFCVEKKIDYGKSVDLATTKTSAAQEMTKLWENLPEDLRVVLSFIKSDREKLVNYFR